jgi:hypothetical protein
MPTFIWWSTGGGGLLNLAKPAQKLYFFWRFFFQNFKKSATEDSFKKIIFSFWRKIRSVLKIFFTSKFVIYFCTTPAIKLKLGQQIISGELLIANHLNQSLWWAIHEQESDQIYYTLFGRCRSYLLHSFLEVQRVDLSFTSHRKSFNYGDPKPFSWAKPAYFDLSSFNF